MNFIKVWNSIQNEFVLRIGSNGPTKEGETWLPIILKLKEWRHHGQMHKVWTCWKVRILCRTASLASHPSWLNSLRQPDVMHCGIVPQTEFWLLPTLYTPVSSMLFHFVLLTVLETWLPSSQTIDESGWTPGWSDIKSVGLALSRIELKVSQLSKTPTGNILFTVHS